MSATAGVGGAATVSMLLSVPLWALVLAALLLVVATVLIVLAVGSRSTRARDAFDTMQRTLRDELAEQGRGQRAELSQSIESFSRQLASNMSSIAQVQNNQIDAFAQQLALSTQGSEARLAAMRDTLSADARAGREEVAAALTQFSNTLAERLAQVSQATDARLAEVRGTLETRLKDLQVENATKLDEMRRTVDEKLQSTLHARLGESFRQVSERLEAVQRGLGEMQALAVGVGDLKRVLSNVKTRGTWGEVQLAQLLGELLTANQFESNVATVPGSAERVEFAIRLPGRAPDEAVWLPIDAKFPREDYERLVDAQERADAAAAEEAGRQLEQRIRTEARAIREKYVSPPATTDFALMFLPTEGLYAEVVRRPGLTDDLQRRHRITVAGPTTLTALLNSLQMGFRTLAIEQRSSEVWTLLGAVKTEFGKFGESIDRVRKHLATASESLEKTNVRTRAIQRSLRSVEALPGVAAAGLLEVDSGDPETAADESGG